MPEAKLQAGLHDGSTIAVEVHGAGPTVLLPVNPQPVEGPQAEELRRWGADPPWPLLIEGLSDVPGGRLRLRRPRPGCAQAGLLDAGQRRRRPAGRGRRRREPTGSPTTATPGWRWPGCSSRSTDRLWALVMGEFPPLDGLYTQMLQVTTATYELASSPGDTATTWQPSEEPSDELDWSQVEVSLTEPQTRQFVTLYQALQDFDDRAAQAQIRCPRLCFVGAADEIAYGERWGGVQVSLAEPIIDAPTSKPSAGRSMCSTGWTTSRPCRPPRSCRSCALAHRCWACRT